MRNFNVRLPNDLDERLKAVSELTGTPMSEVVRRGTTKELDRLEQQHGTVANRVDAVAEAVA